MTSIYDRLDGIYAYIEAKAEQVERQRDELIERSKKHKHGMTEAEKARLEVYKIQLKDLKTCLYHLGAACDAVEFYKN